MNSIFQLNWAPDQQHVDLSYLLDVSKMPLTPPKVERATKTGMMKANLPYRRSAKVCKIMHYVWINEPNF